MKHMLDLEFFSHEPLKNDAEVVVHAMCTDGAQPVPPEPKSPRRPSPAPEQCQRPQATTHLELKKDENCMWIKAVQRGDPQKCGSDDSGQDASWKPDDDEMALDMDDDDDDVTSDGKSVADEDEDVQTGDHVGDRTTSANRSDGKGTGTRRKAPAQTSQEWKDSRKSMKGLRELAALIDGSAQLHENDRRTRRQAVVNRRRKYGNKAGHNGRMPGGYDSCSSGDSSWYNRSGSSCLAASQHDVPGTSEPQKLSLRNSVKSVDLPQSSEFGEMRKGATSQQQKKPSRNFTDDVSSARLLDKSPAANSGGSDCIAAEPNGGVSPFKLHGARSSEQSQDPNPPKRQRLVPTSKEQGDRTGSGGMAENLEDLGGNWEPGLSDVGQDDNKEPNTSSKMEGELDDTQKRSHGDFKLPRMPMIRHEQAWYRARILKTERERIFVEFTGFEDGSLVKPFWIRKDSNQIWTGSYRGKEWKHLGDGAWQPKPPSFKHKKKPKGGHRRGRKHERGDPDMQNSPQRTNPTKDSTDQMASHGDGTNMETEDMGAHPNCGNDDHKSGGMNGGFDDAQEAMEVNQKVREETKWKATSQPVKSSKQSRPHLHSTESDTVHGNQDSGTYPQDGSRSQKQTIMNNYSPPNPRPAEEYESQNRNVDGRSESGVSEVEREKKRICEVSGRGSLPSERDQADKTKASHMSEGVGSAGDSRGSQACSLKKLRSRTGTFDDAVCSSPSSASPGSKVKERKKNGETDLALKGASGLEFSGKKTDNGDTAPENEDGGKLGFKAAWKLRLRGEQRSSDGPEEPEEPEPSPQQLNTKVSTSHPKAEASKRPKSPKISKMGGGSDEPQGATTRSYHRENSRKSIDVGKLHGEDDLGTSRDGRGYQEVGKSAFGRRSSNKRDERIRTGQKLKGRGGGGSIDDEMMDRAGRLSSLSPGTTHMSNGRSALAHIRKHLPYYNEHISDQKLESFVEMMERLDNVVVETAEADNPQNVKAASVSSVEKDGSGAVQPSIAQQQAIGQLPSGAAHHLGHFIPIPVPQPQGQAANVQVPLPWTALNPLFYSSVMQFSPWSHPSHSQPHLQQLQQVNRPPASQPMLKFSQNRTIGGGSRGR